MGCSESARLCRPVPDMKVLPGITGPWQVSGRSDLGFARMLDLDARYVNGASLGMDLRIIVQTIKILLTCKGAY